MKHRALFVRRLAPLATVGAVCAPIAAQAQEAGPCEDLDQVVYVTGSSAAKPFVAAIAARLQDVNVVYQKADSCAGVNAVVADTKITGTASTFTWDEETGKAVENKDGCTLPLAGATVDIGISDVFADSCPNVEDVPNDVEDFTGPVQIMAFVVPVDSTQTVISAEAAYLTYGFGADGEVDPWTDDNLIQQRSSSSGTQNMIANAIGVPAARWVGAANAGSDEMVNSLTAAATAGNSEESLGILGTDRADLIRDSLRVLAYQHYGQSCGYFPDSSATSFDKQNVRDGHYMIWGPIHLLTHVDGDGDPVNPDARIVLDLIRGVSDPDFDLIEVLAKVSLVPDCAMRVSRTTEVGPLASYMPDRSCECKFLAEATGEVPETCAECNDDGDCEDDAPKCNYGFCEVQ